MVTNWHPLPRAGEGRGEGHAHSLCNFVPLPLSTLTVAFTTMTLSIRVLVSCLLAVIIMVPAHGQSDKAVAHANRAIQLMDQGLGRQAIAEWDKAIALEPGIAAYQYERTLCYVMEKDYVTALSMLTPIYRDSNLYDRGYQLMGNIYSLQNDSAQAVNYYREGIAAVPTSGRLHYEIGAAAFIDRKIPEALDWWKRGTRVEPGFATNYYWLAKVYAESKEKLWSVLYGEAFLNLERASERTKEVSKLLFDTWNAALRFGDTLDPINLASEDVLEIPSPLGPNQMNFAMAFEFTVANGGQHLIPASGVLKKLSLPQLVDLRTRFIKAWTQGGKDTTYRNDILAFQAQIAKAGWIKEYFYWLYSYGDKKAMNEYFRTNEHRYDTFLAWFGDTQMPFNTPLCLEMSCP